jgi:rhomboid family protein
MVAAVANAFGRGRRSDTIHARQNNRPAGTPVQSRNSQITPVTQYLIIANVVIFALSALTPLGRELYFYLALWPLPHTQIWQPVTYAFLHGGLFHLLFNMLGLWMFGRVVERQWGAQRYVLYYFVCVVGAAVVHLFASAVVGRGQFTVGASGGVLGVLLAFGMMFPDVRLMVFPLPVPVKAKWAIVGFIVVSIGLGVTDSVPNIAHFAHLGGMLFGWLLIQYWRRGRYGH